MRARAKVYHIECFRCVACSRQLIPGDEFALREDGLFCRADHDVVERASLGGGDPLSPLHPARPLQMAGTARAQRRGNPRGLAMPGPSPGGGESPTVSAGPAPPWGAGRGSGGGAAQSRGCCGSSSARVRGTREVEYLRRGRAPARQPALLLPPPHTGLLQHPARARRGPGTEPERDEPLRRAGLRLQTPPLPQERAEKLFRALEEVGSEKR